MRAIFQFNEANPYCIDHGLNYFLWNVTFVSFEMLGEMQLKSSDNFDH